MTRVLELRARNRRKTECIFVIINHNMTQTCRLPAKAGQGDVRSAGGGGGEGTQSDVEGPNIGGDPG